MSLLDELNQSISTYSKDQLIRMVADRCWSGFLDKELSLEKTRCGRRFIACAPWICFIAASSNIDKRTVKPIIKESLFKLSHKMWKFLDYKSSALSAQEKLSRCDEFMKLYKSALADFFKHNKEESLSHLEFNIDITPTPPLWFKIYQNIQYAEDIRRKNHDIEIKYSTVPIMRSLLIWQKLERGDLETCGLPALNFHQIILWITKVAIERRGVFSRSQLRTVTERDFGNNFAKEKIDSLIDNIVIVLDILSCKNFQKSYAELSWYTESNINPTYNLNPLHHNPLLQLKSEQDVIYLIPSPYALIFSTGWIFWVLLGHLDKKMRPSVDEIGKALTSYIEELLEYYKNYTKELLEVKNLDKEKNKTQMKKGVHPVRSIAL